MRDLGFWTDALAAGSLAVAAITGLAALLQFRLAHRSRATYDSERRQAELSLMRASFERKIADLTADMLATEGRWRDANHLLIESQNATRSFGSKAVDPRKFLSAFGIDPIRAKRDDWSVFVLTPFAQEENETFVAIKNACSKAGFTAIRGDEQNASGAILHHIIRHIVSARIIIANIGSRNANVFYELGIAQALGKPTILVSRNETDAPFDVSGQRIIIFSDDEDLERKLIPSISSVIASSSADSTI